MRVQINYKVIRKSKLESCESRKNYLKQCMAIVSLNIRKEIQSAANHLRETKMGVQRLEGGSS